MGCVSGGCKPRFYHYFVRLCLAEHALAIEVQQGIQAHLYDEDAVLVGRLSRLQHRSRFVIRCVYIEFDEVAGDS